MSDTLTITPFSLVYNYFLSKITDDMYMEVTKEDTYKMLEDLLLSAIPKFEFPRVNIFDFTLIKDEDSLDDDLEYYSGEYTDDEEDEDTESNELSISSGYFNCVLTREEINILATYMIVEWLGQQLASVENIRMKYSGSDFKFTSQANHMSKILSLKKDYEREGFHLQRLYKRRKISADGKIKSTFDIIMTSTQEE